MRVSRCQCGAEYTRRAYDRKGGWQHTCVTRVQVQNKEMERSLNWVEGRTDNLGHLVKLQGERIGFMADAQSGCPLCGSLPIRLIKHEDALGDGTVTGTSEDRYFACGSFCEMRDGSPRFVAKCLSLEPKE